MHSRVASAAVAVALASLGVHAQDGVSQVLNACHVSPIVEDLDRTARFYHELLGMDLMPPPPSGPLPVDTDPGHLLLHGMPGARLRFIQARIPGVRCGIELVEFTNVDRAAIHRRYQDPGAAVLVLTVRNVDAAFAALKKAAVRIVTTGGVPVQTTTSEVTPARAVTVLDPDGHYIELIQPAVLPETAVAASSNVIGIGLRLTVADAEKSVAFYRALLGIGGRIRAFETNRERLALAGLPESATYRSAAIPIPGSSRTLELVEFRDAGSRTLAVPSRVQDPGSYRLQLTFRDIGAALDTFKRFGLGPITTGGAPIAMTFGGGRPWHLAIVPDPSNLFLIVQQAPSQG